MGTGNWEMGGAYFLGTVVVCVIEAGRQSICAHQDTTFYLRPQPIVTCALVHVH